MSAIILSKEDKLIANKELEKSSLKNLNNI